MGFKVYKNDIRNFLDHMQIETSHAIEKKYEEQINMLKMDRSHFYRTQCRQILEDLESLTHKLENAPVPEGIEFVPYSAYGSALSNLRSVIRQLHNAGINNIKNNGAEDMLALERKDALKKIQVEYAKLHGYCAKNSARNTYNMLKSLGFDVSALEQSTEALVVQVDKDVLFPDKTTGDNVVNDQK